MPLTTVNVATATAPASLDTAGDIVLFRQDGAANWVDLGYLRNVSPTANSTTEDIRANRDGIEVTVSSEVTGVTLSLGFGSLAAGDPAVRGLHAGAAAVPGAIPGSAFYTVGVNGLNGAGIVIHKTGKPATNLDTVTFHPAATLRGAGEGKEGSKTLLTFTMDVLSRAGYRPDATTLADFSASEAPYGVIIQVPRERLQALLDALDAEVTRIRAA